MQLTADGEHLPVARAASAARARPRSKSVSPRPANAPTPSLRKSRRRVPSQLRVGSVIKSRPYLSAGGRMVEPHFDPTANERAAAAHPRAAAATSSLLLCPLRPLATAFGRG